MPSCIERDDARLLQRSIDKKSVMDEVLGVTHPTRITCSKQKPLRWQGLAVTASIFDPV
jgi:hypothetical protein